jgi:hypothetical protein
LAGIIEPISDSVVEPSLNPMVDRGRSIVDAAASPLVAQGPLETRPQGVEIPAAQMDEMAARNAEVDEKPGSKKAQQLAQDLEIAKQQGLPIPTITVGRQVTIPPISTAAGAIKPAFNIQHPLDYGGGAYSEVGFYILRRIGLRAIAEPYVSVLWR